MMELVVVFLPFLVAVLILGLLLFGGFQKNVKMNWKLVERFQGRTLFPLGELLIRFQDVEFRISRVGRSGGSGSGGGSYPVLWAYGEGSGRKMIGHQKSGSYTQGRFFSLPPKEVLNIGHDAFLVAADDAKVLAQVKVLSVDPVFQKACVRLFGKEFSHLTTSNEVHILGGLPRKTFVLRYVGLSESIYLNPEELDESLSNVMKCAEVLGISFPRVG
jgi:hypothetical protein